jgi:transcriptional regulator with XRE-family HTH domain
MSLGQIIRKKREQLGLTLDEVGARSGFSKPYLSTIETGKVHSPPSDELLVKLEKILEFENGLLLYIAHFEKMPSDIRLRYESAQTENRQLKLFIRNLIREKKQPAAIDTLLAKSPLSIDLGEECVSAGLIVPVINKADCQYPQSIGDLDDLPAIAEDYIRCPDLDDPKAFAVRVFGDAMEPRFSHGSIVVFSPAADVSDGDDCFISLASARETTFKRVFFEKNNAVRLQPRNEKYSPAIVSRRRIRGIYCSVLKIEKL